MENKSKDGNIAILSADGKAWKKKQCSLKDRILYIYENKTTKVEDSKILHFIPLARCGVITTAVKGPTGKANCFKISHQFDDSIMYWFSTETDDELKDWVATLQVCCAIQKEPEQVEAVRGRSKSIAFKPDALQLAGISDFSGWLKKQSTSGLRKGWKKRWCVLKDMVLYYYEGPESKLKGKQSIPGWSVEADNSLPFCIKLSHPAYPVLLLQAENEEDRTKWINNIKENHKHLTASSSASSASTTTTPSSTPVKSAASPEPKLMNGANTSSSKDISESSDTNSNLDDSSSAVTTASKTTVATPSSKEEVVEEQKPTENSVVVPTLSINHNHNNNNINSIDTDLSELSQMSSAPTTPSKVLSPGRPALKRVETKDVLSEFDKMFSSFAVNLVKCGLCKEPITSGQTSIEAVGQQWHSHHLLCCQCGKHLIGLEEIPYVERDGKLYCKEDHDKTFKESNCHKCQKSLMINFVHKGKVYCKDHYALEIEDLICQGCEKPLGDLPYYSFENKKWHHDHFKCAYCKHTIHNPSDSHFKNKQPYCKNCYKSLF
ncbi:prespore-specific protein [Heterostelium album PN500]|uniref:Prespore-specific protein n=1 Tax=Heterostelium pallidum (strain ATCC 26659 / Pp 5 / PN500) TaxID=670386 RepID=D3B6X2_HETP5|nr:prespore-specific protein [Heterostelium album PN500]EFA82515.1 prespore-specific protein [Heterostelium album PN500]|eukprot:XP_020434632.1 prespore-specific protein [Heterostelium album PN500]